MKLIISLLLLNTCWNHAISQDSLALPLSTCVDSSVYPYFIYISPEKNSLQTKLPPIRFHQYTLSRSIQVKSLGITIPILIGITPSRDRIIVIDQNMNNDLSDDKVIDFTDTLNGIGKGNYKHFSMDIPAGLNYRNIPIEFDYTIIKPPALFLHIPDTLENQFYFAIRPGQYRKATLSLQNSSYTILLLTDKVLNFEKSSAHLIVSADTGVIHNFKKQPSTYSKYSLGDIVLAGNRKYVFQRLSPLGDTLFLKPLSADTDLYGSKVGFLANKISGTDLLTHRPISSDSYPGKYILLDFWGTWCGPCLSILPDIKKLHEKLNPDKIALISICYDTDPETVTLFLKNNKITWPQILDPKGNPAITNLLDVKSYPFFILIDPNGKIIYRDESTDGFYRMQNKIEELITTVNK